MQLHNVPCLKERSFSMSSSCILTSALQESPWNVFLPCKQNILVPEQSKSLRNWCFCISKEKIPLSAMGTHEVYATETYSSPTKNVYHSIKIMLLQSFFSNYFLVWFFVPCCQTCLWQAERDASPLPSQRWVQGCIVQLRGPWSLWWQWQRKLQSCYLQIIEVEGK